MPGLHPIHAAAAVSVATSVIVLAFMFIMVHVGIAVVFVIIVNFAIAQIVHTLLWSSCLLVIVAVFIVVAVLPSFCDEDGAIVIMTWSQFPVLTLSSTPLVWTRIHHCRRLQRITPEPRNQRPLERQMSRLQIQWKPPRPLSCGSQACAAQGLSMLRRKRQH